MLSGTVNPAPAKIKLLIVDDHAETRGLIREVIGHFAAEIRECADGAAAIRECEIFAPDFVTMDMHMKPMNGLQTLKKILARRPSARVIMVTQSTSQPVHAAALQAGA